MAAEGLEAAKIALQVVCGVGLVANLLVMAVFAATRKLRVKYYGLVFNLVITDIAVATVAILYQHRPHPAVLSLTAICFFTEALNILAVAVNRLVALSVKPPARYDEIVTRGRLVAVCVLMWIVSAAIDVPLTYAVASNVNRLVMPLITLTILISTGVVYGVVFLKINSYKAPLASSPGIGKDDEQGNTSRLRQTRRLMVTFTIILMVCCVCWLPNIIGNLLVAFSGHHWWDGQTEAFRLYFKSSAVILVTNSAVNPFIYWWRIDDFRAGLYGLVCSCRQRPQTSDAESADLETAVDSTL